MLPHIENHHGIEENRDIYRLDNLIHYTDRFHTNEVIQLVLYEDFLETVCSNKIYPTRT